MAKYCAYYDPSGTISINMEFLGYTFNCKYKKNDKGAYERVTPSLGEQIADALNGTEDDLRKLFPKIFDKLYCDINLNLGDLVVDLEYVSILQEFEAMYRARKRIANTHVSDLEYDPTPKTLENNVI